MSDFISRKDAYKVLSDYYHHRTATQHDALKEALSRVPSAEPWDIVKTVLKELEQKEEKLCADYCDATARLKAISKIADSSQSPKQKIVGIKPLAELG